MSDQQKWLKDLIANLRDDRNLPPSQRKTTLGELKEAIRKQEKQIEEDEEAQDLFLNQLGLAEYDLGFDAVGGSREKHTPQTKAEIDWYKNFLKENPKVVETLAGDHPKVEFWERTYDQDNWLPLTVSHLRKTMRESGVNDYEKYYIVLGLALETDVDKLYNDIYEIIQAREKAKSDNKTEQPSEPSTMGWDEFDLRSRISAKDWDQIAKIVKAEQA